MKKAFMFFCAIIGGISPILAELYPVYGFMCEVSGLPPQSFSDIKYIDIPDDVNEPYHFVNQDWVYREDYAEDVELCVSTSSDDKLLIDLRCLYGPEVMVFVLNQGNINYYYTDNLQAVQASLNGNMNSYSSGNVDSNNGGGNYATMYAKWERQAENAYDSLTDASVNSSTYVRNKQLLRDAQNEMRRCRRQAAAAGVTINKSRWEDAQVRLR